MPEGAPFVSLYKKVFKNGFSLHPSSALHSGHWELSCIGPPAFHGHLRQTITTDPQGPVRLLIFTPTPTFYYFSSRPFLIPSVLPHWPPQCSFLTGQLCSLQLNCALPGVGGRILERKNGGRELNNIKDVWKSQGNTVLYAHLKYI